jgi:hypothetical protein
LRGKAAESERFGYQLRLFTVKFFAYLFLGIRKAFEEKGERLVGERPNRFGAGFVDAHDYGFSNQRQVFGVFESN